MGAVTHLCALLALCLAFFLAASGFSSSALSVIGGAEASVVPIGRRSQVGFGVLQEVGRRMSPGLFRRSFSNAPPLCPFQDVDEDEDDDLRRLVRRAKPKPKPKAASKPPSKPAAKPAGKPAAKPAPKKAAAKKTTKKGKAKATAKAVPKATNCEPEVR
jgi:hypothetical protein